MFSTIPQPIILLAIAGIAIFLFFFWLTMREKKAFVAIYNNFDARDLFVEDMLSRLSANINRLLMALIAIPLLIVGMSLFFAKNDSKIAELKKQNDSITAEIESIKQQKQTLQDDLAKSQMASQAESDPEILNNIKQEYEKAFVNYFYLNRCGKANAYDASLIINMLSMELASNRANSQMIEVVINTAMATYIELYSTLPCNAKDINTLAEAQKKYSEAVLQNIQNRMSIPTR